MIQYMIRRGYTRVEVCLELKVQRHFIRGAGVVVGRVKPRLVKYGDTDGIASPRHVRRNLAFQIC